MKSDPWTAASTLVRVETGDIIITNTSMLTTTCQQSNHKANKHMLNSVNLISF